jgi:TonB family protein
MKKILVIILSMVSLQVSAQITDTIEAKKNALKKVEHEAVYEGGMNKLINFLTKNLKYPKEMMEYGYGGESTIEFVVCADGSICNAKVTNKAGKLFDNEALRVVQLMPKWKPGMQDGKAVSSYYSLPITYLLSGDENDVYKKHSLISMSYCTNCIKFFRGEDEMKLFIDNNIQIKLPKKPVSVSLNFTVSKSGETINIECVNTVDEKYKLEAIRILKLFPTWIPATIEGDIAFAKMKLAIVFKKYKSSFTPTLNRKQK